MLTPGAAERSALKVGQPVKEVRAQTQIRVQTQNYARFVLAQVERLVL